jgi:CheY-like chemotaxis protein
VVDDEPLSLVSARMTLRQRGLRVVEADSKAKAMDALRSVRDLDLVLLDIRGLNGPEVLKSIRKLSITQAQIPVVAFTAFYDEDSPNIFASMGFDGYLPKPIPQEGLPLEIGQLISNWRVRRVQIERDKRRPR